MDLKYINAIAEAMRKVDEKMKLDPVDQKALKGKHADRKDKDIDNDGDVDKSDEYLHKRRQAVSKAMKNESEDEMKPCPKCDGSMQNHDPECPMADKGDDDDMEKDESCGKKMKKESVEVDEGAFKGVGKFIAKRKFANKSKQAYKDAEKSISKAHKYNFDDVKNREPHEKDFTDKMKKSDRYDRAAKRLNRESVAHEQWGYGEVIETTENGFNVYFEHGVEFDVSESELMFLEKNYAMRTKGATKPETMLDKYKGKAATDMAKDSDMEKPEMVADDEKGHTDATKAGRATKQSPARGPADKLNVGDKKPVKQGGK
jgi:hypothetical protein